MVGGAAALWDPSGRPGRDHRPQHPRPPGDLLRRPPDRRRAGADQLPADRRRLRLPHRSPGVAGCVALEGAREGWLEYEAILEGADPGFRPVEIAERDLVSINYTSGTTSRPKGVMITHRNAALNVLNTLAHHPMDPGDRYLWTLPMFHANGWTFVWIVTAVGAAHVCLRKVEPRTIFQLIAAEGITMFCAAPTVLIGVANAPPELRGSPRTGIRILTAGAPPAATTIERVEGELGWTITQVYGLTETSPFITRCEPLPEHGRLTSEARAAIKARQGVELLTSGELDVVDESGHPVPHHGATMGE